MAITLLELITLAIDQLEQNSRHIKRQEATRIIKRRLMEDVREYDLVTLKWGGDNYNFSPAELKEIWKEIQ